MARQTDQSFRLEADTNAVADLVGKVRRGIIRIPEFQRPLQWESEDVLRLFDSVYKGYPIGSLLLRQGPAPAAALTYGPLTVDAPATQAALWVVDGQQRLTALAAGLARSAPVPVMPLDAWVVYFDAGDLAFRVPSRTGGVPDTWVPVAQLLDASSLSEWVFNWPHSGNPALRRAVFEAGARLREYQVPLYVVETDDEQLLRDIFYRINNSGKPLGWEDIHDALFGRKSEHPSTLKDLSDELATLGMGRPEEEQLLSCLLAYKGLDVTRSVSVHYDRNPEVLKDVVRAALPAIQRVLSFLRIHGEIPHLRLLPRSLPLVVLTRFFAAFPEPSSRSLELLTRWTWRTLLNIASFDERTVLRHGVALIEEGREEASVQSLLELVPSERPGEFALPKRFDARAADSRIVLVAMASLRPRSLVDGEPINIRELIQQHDINAFRKIVPDDRPLARSPANRILSFGRGTARLEFIDLIQKESAENVVLRSHAISAHAAEALVRRDTETFIGLRKAVIEDVVRQLGDRLAAWGANDRPSVQYLLGQVEETADD